MKVIWKVNGISIFDCWAYTRLYSVQVYFWYKLIHEFGKIHSASFDYSAYTVRILCLLILNVCHLDNLIMQKSCDSIIIRIYICEIHMNQMNIYIYIYKSIEECICILEIYKMQSARVLFHWLHNRCTDCIHLRFKVIFFYITNFCVYFPV